MLSTTWYFSHVIYEDLHALGFSEKEAEIYIAVLRRGKMLPADLAKITGINRSTVYSLVKELVKKGVVREDLGGPTKYVVALPPEELHNVVSREEKVLAKKKEVIPSVIDGLQHIIKDQTYSIPKIVFIPEQDVETYLYKQTDAWNESIKKRKTKYWGFQDRHFVKHYEQWIDDYWVKTRSSDNIELCLLSDAVAEKIKGKKYPYRHIKFWEKTKNFTSTLWVMGDYIVTIITEQRPHYLVEIHDITLAHNLREVFKGLWEEIG